MRFQRRQLLRTLSFAFASSLIWSRNLLGIAAQTATRPKVSPPPAGAAVRNGVAGGTEMEKMTGIGGLFFRAHDPKALGRWYQHLGISLTPSRQEDSIWQQEAGPTVFAPFEETSDYFGDAHKVWMVNFRVRDLDKMAAQLKVAGIAVKIDAQFGRFLSVRSARLRRTRYTTVRTAIAGESTRYCEHGQVAEARRAALREIEGDQANDSQQEFLAVAACVAREGRLSRFV